MKKIKFVSISICVLFLLSSCISVFGENLKTKSDVDTKSIDYIEKSFQLELSFSDPEIVDYNNYSIIRVNETNHNRIILFDYDPGKPVLPVNISVFSLPFGSKIKNVDYEHNEPEIYNLTNKIAFGKSTTDGYNSLSINTMDTKVYESNDSYPSSYVQYHTGGGLYKDSRTSFFVLRVYPAIYYPSVDQIHFIKDITVNISYEEPKESLIQKQYPVDLLILSPSNFARYLKPLVEHKITNGIKTKFFTLNEVYSSMDGLLNGRDRQEKIKYFIKTAIERWDIKYVLLVGGIKGQSDKWNIPVRYSHVVPPSEQEYPEQSFISDLYYADIYNSEGDFSSWDSNYDNQFSVWNESFKEKMDLYPDVYLGRLPCRNLFEVKILVKKIIDYENSNPRNKDWFENLILVAGDSYNDTYHYNEGELIGEKTVEKMPGFNPIRVYASEMDINRETVNNAMNEGASFAYFCGHGSAMSWSTHYPPNGTIWTTGYKLRDMIFLRNQEKLPVTVVGGCHNGQFDVTLYNIILGLKQDGLQYFSRKPGNRGKFWQGQWPPNCWAWWLTSKSNGGAIATIANTGLGTHGDGDQDNNSVADYLEVLDGWLELRFLELYGLENQYILGANHAQTLTEYLHQFLGDDSKMDVKMVQQWELFGDPSLQIGGYR